MCYEKASSLMISTIWDILYFEFNKFCSPCNFFLIAAHLRTHKTQNHVTTPRTKIWPQMTIAALSRTEPGMAFSPAALQNMERRQKTSSRTVFWTAAWTKMATWRLRHVDPWRFSLSSVPPRVTVSTGALQPTAVSDNCGWQTLFMPNVYFS